MRKIIFLVRVEGNERQFEMAKSDADKAYEWAVGEIARVKAAGETILDFNVEEALALTQLPPEIADLTALQNLDLMNTQVTDISVLKDLTALQNLNLRGTQITDINVLKDLTALQSLDLWGTQVTDISVLKDLTALQNLYLSDTQVTDISVL
ncbi:MAG: leucine-rich repeat domain-containing protein, partial [Rhodobacteraceae bacterium]|nr:leucine-rich repeat domain-containing protein [Paracoccaceae bacterium]